DRVAGAEVDHVIKTQPAQPLAVEPDLRFPGIEDFEDLRFVRFRIAIDLLARERGTRDVAAGGIADQAGHIADQEDHGVAEILKVLHLAKQHRVAQVQVGRGGVESGFDTQRTADLEALDEVLLADDFGHTFLEVGDLLGNGNHYSYCRKRGSVLAYTTKRDENETMTCEQDRNSRLRQILRPYRTKADVFALGLFAGDCALYAGCTALAAAPVPVALRFAAGLAAGVLLA